MYSYKELYKVELIQMKREGYEVDAFISTADDENFMPDASYLAKEEINDLAWQRAYENLVALKKNGIRKDYPYIEPNDYDGIIAEATDAPELEKLTDEEYKKRLSGAFIGRCCGIVLGKPFECGFNNKQIKEFLVNCNSYPLRYYSPFESKNNKGEKWELRGDCRVSTLGNINYVQSDDDVNYTLLSLLLMEHCGTNFTKKNVGYNFLNNCPYHWFWCASRLAYYKMVNLNNYEDVDKQVDTFAENLNPWRECIDGQIKTDGYGYVFPADPRKAALYAERDNSFSLTKNGKYGGMFVAACISCALSKNPTVEKIIAGGLSVIPKKSRLAEAVNDVVAWYKENPDFDGVCDKVHEKYGYLDGCATENNIAMVVLGILSGNMNYTDTICNTNMCGIDTDCNAGTAGSIIGAAVGIDGIDKKWYEPLNDTIKSTVAAIGQTSMTEIINRYYRLYKRYN